LVYKCRKPVEEYDDFEAVYHNANLPADDLEEE